MIQEKINFGEGWLLLSDNNWYKAKELNELTDPKWDLSIEDYQDRINFLKDENRIDEEKLVNDRSILENELIEINKELDNQEIKSLFQKVRNEEKRFDLNNNDSKIREKEERKFYSDQKIRDIENQISFLQREIFNKINKKKNEIDLKNIEIKNNKKKFEEKMQEISTEINTTRKATNLDYQYYQGLTIVKKLTKHEMTHDGDGLRPYTEVELLDIVKDKKKKEIANQLNIKYPEKLLDGTLNVLYQEKVNEIEACETIENVKLIKVD